MLVIECKEYLEKIRFAASELGALDKLEKQLEYLASYACRDGADNVDLKQTKTYLSQDFAPLSFAFRLSKRCEDGTYRHWFNGGLIYSGPAQALNGSGPAFTVSLDPDAGKDHNWSVHT
jgi:hypothetical protein